MTCQERQAKFTDWILEELGAEETRALELHVEQCTACAQALAQLRSVEQTLRQGLADREMPARLVFVPEKPRSFAAGLWPSLARTAALAGAAAVVFLALVFVGAGYWQRPPVENAQAGMTRAEVTALVDEAVERRLQEHGQEFLAANEQLLSNLQQDQRRQLAAVLQKLNYLEAAQKVVWEENQQQNAYMQLIARNSLQAEPARPTQP